ncbi:hypothetical protein D3C81_1151420 [compost metagenome]
MHAGFQVIRQLPRLHASGQRNYPAVVVRPGGGAKLPAQFHPAHAGQVNVQQDQVEAPLCAQLQGLPGILGKAHPVAIAHQQAARHLTVQRDVLDHQDIQAGADRLGRGIGRNRLPKGDVEFEPEAAALPLYTVQANAAPQLFHQVLADRQAQTGATVASRHRLAGLDETVEDPGLHGRLDTDAVVTDR